MKSTYVIEINIYYEKMLVFKICICEKLHKAEIVQVGTFLSMECFYIGLMYHSSCRPFYMIAGYTTITAVPFYCEQGTMCISLIHCSEY